jgi:DNA polymerase III sliding clamp (beta) subunit (PCNA family)
MKIETNRASLAAALDTCLSATESKGASPILGCVLLVAKGKTMTIAATDLNITAVVELEVSGSGGEVIANAKELRDIVKNLPADGVSLDATGSVLVLKSGRFTRQMPMVANHNTFPKVAEPKSSWQPFPSSAMSEVMRYCAPAMCQDETRFHINGVRLQANGSVIRGASTSGNCVHLSERSAEVSWDGDAIVPAKAVRAIIALLKGEGEMVVARDKEALHVKCGAARLSAKLHDAQFLNVEAPLEIALGGNKGVVDVDRQLLLAAAERTAIAGEDVRVLALDFRDGEVGLRCKDSDGRVAEDSIEATGKTKELVTGANPKFLTTALGSIGGDRVTFRIGGPQDPIIIHRAGDVVSTKSGDVCFFAPMRVA